MRILIKGGVWKNTEDEILKAAVMKYGKNQWARVASLLNRKSAKQCKARWYEWLDPSIKKTEWSRDEEEKLLHLAKLMPNQWRTIAPIVGRTAGQCMEQYERLLDMAQEKMDVTEDAEDPRSLRAGEIDPAPETKPARPDPVDMDEDEKEMLSEARARLANTKGKKAKRKARERQLEESRRLSMLQKRRELKAAGIESRLGGGGNKRKYIDYAKEIPFQKVVPAGFYDVSTEDSRAKLLKLDPVAMGMELQKLEGRHEREEEERARNTDKKKLKTLFKTNAALAVKLIEDANDPSAVRRRSALNLPAPQVSDVELEEIVKVGQASLAMGPPEGSMSLLGDYSAAYRATPTPSRTPLQEDVIMQEARNLRAIREMTPLLGNDLPELYEGTGFEGATPRMAKLATPNTLVGTPSTQSSVTPLRTSTSTNGASRASKQLLLRDHFGLNDATSMHDDGFSVSEFSVASDRARDKAMKAQLKAQLQGLPEPEYTYEISVPTVADEGDEEEKVRVEDAADLEDKQRLAMEASEREELARRSSVLRRRLPRPFLQSTSAFGAPSSHLPNDPALLMASSMVNQEAARLITRDNVLFPHETIPGSSADVEELDIFDDFLLQQARELIAAEIPDEASSVCIVPSVEVSKYRYIPNGNGGGSFKIPSDKAELLLACETNLMALKSRYDKDVKKADKVEKKLTLLTQGYAMRMTKLLEGIAEKSKTIAEARIETESYKKLAEAEVAEVVDRLSQSRKDLREAQELEVVLQARYAALLQ